MKTFYTLLFILLNIMNIRAQQVPRYSQYIMNEFLVNPSIAGYDGRTTFNLVGRKEWIGFTQNTPETFSFNAQTRILKSPLDIKSGLFGKLYKSGSKGRVGLGFNIFSDNNGAVTQSGAQLVYAYHIFLQNTQLSFGLGGTMQQHRISRDKAILKDQTDNMNALIGKATWTPDFSLGVSLLSEKYHMGLSLAHLLQSKIKFGSPELVNPDSSDFSLKRNYFFLFSYRDNFFRHNKWEYEPSFIIRTNEKLQTLADFTVKFFYNREYWFGLSARTSAEFVLLTGLRYKNYYFGYSFDYGFNRVSRFSKGSHELIISAKFGDSVRRYKWMERY